MAARSQDGSFEASGRVNQKRRTRAAILAAAKAVLDRGETPTVARVAEEALMTRTTVYRYFPSQESLLVELTLDATGLDQRFHDLVAAAPDDATPQERLLDVVDELNRFVADNEALFRSAQRHYHDTWLAAERAGEGHDRQVRVGRRYQWIAEILEPLRGELPDEQVQRLHAALCLVLGGEAITVLRDVARLDADEAIEVAHWAAEALLAAGLGVAPATPARRGPAGRRTSGRGRPPA